jgi:sodium-dependent dicarboxylate transporter 2/3/5
MLKDKILNILKGLRFSLGPFLFILVQFMDFGLRADQQNFLAIFIMVVCFWLLTNIPLFVSGILGVGLSVLYGITSAKEALIPFAHPIIFLFMGGFLFARALQNTGLDKKISIRLLASKFVGGNFDRMFLGILFLTAIFSMWISNTATTAMMLPVVLGLLTSLDVKDKKTISMVLIAMAYASSIGGLATPIGSTPNMILMGLLNELLGIKINFFDWMMMGFPITILLILGLNFLVKRTCDFSSISFNREFIENEEKN